MKALETADPIPLLDWLRRPRTAPMVQRFIQQTAPITHELLDTFWPDRKIHAFRAVLVAGGALEPRDELYANFNMWLDNLLNSLGDREQRRTIENYSRWGPVRRLGTQASRGLLTAGQTASARIQIRLAVDLLSWMKERGTEIHQFRQGDLESYLADKPSAGTRIWPFIKWLARSGRTGSGSNFEVNFPMTIPARPSLAYDERWGLVNRLLHDDSIAPADRFAGLLILMFGQKMTAIVQLETNALKIGGGETSIRLGDHALILPQPVADIAALAISARRHHIRLTKPQSISWLYPGGLPGTHLHPTTLGKRLKAIGVSPQRGKNTALLDLAARLPSAVIAGLLGLSYQTAVKLTSASAQSAGRYSAEVVRRRAGSAQPTTTGRSGTN